MTERAEPTERWWRWLAMLSTKPEQGVIGAEVCALCGALVHGEHTATHRDWHRRSADTDPR